MLEQSFGIIPLRKNPNPEVFLIQHRRGHWGLPKGHKEGIESPEESARREFEEETGMYEYVLHDFPPLVEHYNYLVDGKRRQKEVTYFIATVEDTTYALQKKEVKNGGWFTEHAAMKRVTFPEVKTVLKEAFQAYRTL